MTRIALEAAIVGALTHVGESAVRAGLLAMVVAAALGVLRVRRISIRLFVWTVVLCGGLAMPVLGTALPALPLRLLPAMVARRPAVVDTPGAIAVIGSNHAAEGISGATGGLSVSNSGARDTSAQETKTGEPARFTRFWPILLLVVYLLGALVMLARAAMGWAASRRFARLAPTIEDFAARARIATLSTRAGLARPPRVVASQACMVPITMGLVDPVIALPDDWRDWPATTLDAVLTHELAHIARRDVLMHALALLHRAVFWFSPLGWWLRRHLEQLAEYASDEAVLDSGVDRATYAEILLRFFSVLCGDRRRAEWSVLSASSGHVAMAQISGPERRVDRILAWRSSRKLPTGSEAAIVVAVCSIVAAVGAVTPVAAVVELPIVAASVPDESLAAHGTHTSISTTRPHAPVATHLLGTAERDETRLPQQNQRPSAVSDAWRGERAAMFRQLLDRAWRIREDLQVKARVGTLVPLNASAHEWTMSELQRAADADAHLLGDSSAPSDSDIASIKDRFAHAIDALDVVERRFDVGLSTTTEVDDALMAALAVFQPSQVAGGRPGADTTAIAPQVLQARVEAILVDVVVRDRAGAIVSDLKADEFHLFEDGIEQRIETASPVSINDAAAQRLDYYLLSYYSSQPAAAPGQFRRIVVHVSRPNVAIDKVRSGYYADGQTGATSAAAADNFAVGAHKVSEPGIIAPRVRTAVQATYTPDAIRAKIQGTVELDVIIEPDGTVSRSRLTRSLDARYGLDEQAMKAVSQWKFTPGTFNGEPARVVMKLEMTFALR